MNVLDAKNLHIGYRAKKEERLLVQNFNLELKPGNLVALIGANGAGKSTLLRVIGGLQEPLQGVVYWNAQPLPQISLAERPRQLSALFRNYAMPDGLSVRELVAMGRQPHTGFWGKLLPKDYEAVDEAIEAVGLTHLLRKEINTLSDGELQKALIAKMLAQDAPVMLLDEPTTHLDLPSAIELIKLLRSLAAKRDKAIIFSTHHLALAFKMAPQIVLLAGNGEWAMGTPQVLSAHHLLCGFLRTKHISLVDGHLNFELDDDEN